MNNIKTVQQIIDNYNSETPGVRGNIYRLLSNGALAGTGKMLILPVDQGFEHGPDRSFAPNPDGYDPLYHCKFAVEAGMSAFAAPIGMIEAAAEYAGHIPMILKMNSSNSLMPSDAKKDQAVYANVDDALRLGCSAIGFTIYPGSSTSLEMFEEISYYAREAKNKGLAVVVWSYPRGEQLDSKAETALDVIAHATQIAALIGAHIIKVKLPTSHIDRPDNITTFKNCNITGMDNASCRVAHVMKAAFNGKRIVVFSGGSKKSADSVFEDAVAIRDGGGHGTIIGRNTFQRPKEEAMKMIHRLVSIYKE